MLLYEDLASALILQFPVSVREMVFHFLRQNEGKEQTLYIWGQLKVFEG